MQQSVSAPNNIQLNILLEKLITFHDLLPNKEDVHLIFLICFGVDNRHTKEVLIAFFTKAHKKFQ